MIRLCKTLLIVQLISFPILADAAYLNKGLHAFTSAKNGISAAFRACTKTIAGKLQHYTPCATKQLTFLGHAASQLGNIVRHHKIITGAVCTYLTFKFLFSSLGIGLMLKIPCVQHTAAKIILPWFAIVPEDGTALPFPGDNGSLFHEILAESQPPSTTVTERDKMIINTILRCAFGNIDSPQCISFHNKKGETLLHAAVKNNKYFIATYLLAHGHAANANKQDQNGNTPLHYAQTLSMWQRLVEKGADLSIENKNKHTPMAEQVTMWQQHLHSITSAQ